MSETLPSGWVNTRLSDVCLPVDKIRPIDSPDVVFTYFDIGGIDNKRNIIAEAKTLTGREAPVVLVKNCTEERHPFFHSPNVLAENCAR